MAKTGDRLDQIFRQKRLLIIGAAAVFAAGLAAGCFLPGRLSGEALSPLSTLAEQYLQALPAGAESGAELLRAWRNISLSLGLLWLLGMTAVGLPLVFLALAYKGFALGFTAAILIMQDHFEGITAALLTLLPQNLLLVPLWLLAAVLAADFSLDIWRGALDSARFLGKRTLRYSLLFAALLLPGACGALLQAKAVPALLAALFHFS